jgi:hypothetical protein
MRGLVRGTISILSYISRIIHHEAEHVHRTRQVSLLSYISGIIQGMGGLVRGTISILSYISRIIHHPSIMRPNMCIGRAKLVFLIILVELSKA